MSRLLATARRIKAAAGDGTVSPTLVQLSAKVGPMAVRGVAMRPRLRSAEGLLLLGRGVRIRNPQFISTGAGVVIEDFAEVQGCSIEGIHIGNGVTIGAFAMIRPSGYYGRDPGVGLHVGDRSNIGAYCYLGCSGGIHIGAEVLMGPRVSLEAENHDFDRVDIPIKDQGVTRRRIVVEDGAWLATGCVVLPGVTVGRGAVVAAGAVVTRDVPAMAVVAGVPARVIRTRGGDDPGR